ETKTKRSENKETKKNQTNQPKQKAKQGNKQKNKQHKNQKAKQHHEAPKQQNKKQETPSEIVYHSTLTVSELAEKLNKDSSEIIKKLMFLGVMATINNDLDDDDVEIDCSEYDVVVVREVIM